MGDRSGGREPKGASLKKSKKNPGASAAKQKKASLKSLGITTGIKLTSLPPPLPIYHENAYFDCGIALLSRQFDRDRDRVIIRAHQPIQEMGGNCFGMLIWFSDIEKQSLLADICKTNSGFVYYATGIHPDNIDRTNKKSQEEWLEKTEEFGKKSECIALLSGLNLGREMGTHFSQESLLTSSLALAKKLQLPLILHLADGKSLERALEILYPAGGAEDGEGDDEEETSDSIPIIIHDLLTCSGADLTAFPPKSSLLSHPNLYFIITGAGITETTDPTKQEILEKSNHFLSQFPLERLLVATDSPWKTPQNLQDAYLKTLRNESSNIEFIIQAMGDCFKLTKDEMAKVIKENTMRLFGLEHLLSHSASSYPLATTTTLAAGAAGEDGEDEEGDVEETKKQLQEMHIHQPHHQEEEGKAEKAEKGNKKGDKKGKKEKGKASKHSHHHEEDDDEEIIPAAETLSATPAASTAPSIQFKCVKCRKNLFTSKDLTTHTLGATKTVFKVGEEGLCTSFHFVNAPDGREIHKRLEGLQIRGGNAECSECGSKLGKFCPGEGICSCGAVVAGPVVKINANKVDLHDQSLDTKELVERSKLEQQEVIRERELEDLEFQEALQNKTGKVKKVKKHKSENRGNFSNFRNKSFVPNASKKKKDEEGGGEGEEGGDNEEGEGEEDSDASNH